MGIVYEARDRQRNIHVALKTLRHLEAASLYRFKREFRAVSDLSHPNIVSLYELVADADEWFFTMEVVRGSDLIEYVRAHKGMEPLVPTPSEARTAELPLTSPGKPLAPGGAPLPDLRPALADLVDPTRLRDAFGQLARALHALHQAGLVHRDLKPSNVRVTEHGRVVLMDFGIVADRAEGSVGMRSTRTVGTPAYMAPEQATGDPPTAAADWYAFGVMLYLALTGFVPFSGTPREILRAKLTQLPTPVDDMVRGIPEDLGQLCIRLLDRRPKRRPSPARILATLGVDAAEVLRDGAGGDVFVGRGHELDLLRRAFAAVRGEANVSVTVLGESGMGKSTLVRRFLDTIQAQGAGSQASAPVVLTGRCHERESLLFNAFDGVIDSLSHALLDLPERTTAALVPGDIGLLTRLFPVLRQVPSIESAAVPKDIHPRELRIRAAQALRTLLTELGQRKPVIIYIDDLQWADRDSLELLVDIMGGSRGIFLITTLRPDTPKEQVLEAVEAISRQCESHRLMLGPLSPEERHDLLDKLMTHHPSAGVSMRARGTLWSEAEGSPLLLVELVRFLEEAGDQGDAGTLGLGELLSRRIARLPREARVLLEATAIANEPMPHGILATAGELGAEERQHALMLLRSSRLIRIVQPGANPWITANHARVRDAVIAYLGPEEVERLHAGLAGALDTWGQASPEALARHWRAAGDRDRARTYLVQAARTAEDKLAFDRAAELYRDALELGTSQDAAAELLPRLGDALQLAGRSYEAATVYEQAAERAGGEQALELRRLAADEWLRSGHMARGLERLAEVMKELGVRYARTRTGAIASVLVQRARLGIRGRDFQIRDARELASQDLARLDTLYAAATTLGFIDHLRGTALQTHHVLSALEIGEEHRVCRALGLEYAYDCVSGKGGRAEVEIFGNDVLAHARRLGDPYTLGVVLVCRGGAQFFSGRAAEAVRTLRECNELLRSARRPVEWEKRTAQYLLSLALIATGDLSGAMRKDEHYVDEAERMNDVYARTMFLCVPGTWTLLSKGEPEAADRRLDTALRGWPEDAFYVAGYVQIFGRVLVRLYTGQGESALRLMDEAMPGIRNLMLHRAPWVWSEINALIGRAAVQSPDWRTARKRAKKAIRVLVRCRMTYTRGVAMLLQAAVHARDGERERAIRTLRHAMDPLTAVSARHLLAACQTRLGELLGDSEGEALVRRGQDGLRACGVVQPGRMLDVLAPGFARAPREQGHEQGHEQG